MPTPPDSAVLPVTLRQATRYWFKLGCTSFGGPAGQIAMMHQELVDRRRWISEGRFLHALNYCMALPGPEAQQLATYIGWLMHGVRGALIAGGLFVLPSLLLLIALSWLYMSLGADITTQALYGVKPAVVAIIALAAWRLGRRVLKQPALWAIALAAMAAMAFFQIPFPVIIALAAGMGWLLRARLQTAQAHDQSGSQVHAPALIDDDTPPPVHTRYSQAGILRLGSVALLLWGVAYALTFWGGTVLTDMAGFFSRAALITFGGAYAVMPYVFQSAVETYQWLTPSQMLDGLALGETTPGPLIMVVAFIGFVGAWTQWPGIPEALAGTLGACVATFFTFLPSFVFILAGGPWVERTRGAFRWAGPLTAISAAVVGTILCLAGFVARHVLWPAGDWWHPDVFAVGLMIVAGVVLYRQRLGMVPVLVGCGIMGALKQTLF